MDSEGFRIIGEGRGGGLANLCSHLEQFQLLHGNVVKEGKM